MHIKYRKDTQAIYFKRNNYIKKIINNKLQVVNTQIPHSIDTMFMNARKYRKEDKDLEKHQTIMVIPELKAEFERTMLHGGFNPGLFTRMANQNKKKKYL